MLAAAFASLYHWQQVGTHVNIQRGVPNLNEVLIHVNGLRYPWNYLQLLWYMRQPVKSLTIKSVVVLPEWQKRGAAVLLFDEMAKRAKAKGYQWADLSITSADNPDTPQLAAHMGAVEYKRWQVYNYFISSNVFKRR